MDFSLKALKLYILLLICLHFNYQFCNGLRILGIFPVHSRSNFIMSQKLLENLVKKGHQVDVYSHFPLKTPLSNYTDYSLAGTVPELMNNVTYKDILSFRQNLIYKMKEVVDLCGRPMCDLLGLPIFQKLIHNPPQDPPYDIIISQIGFALCHAAWSRHLNIPLIDIWSNVLPDWLFEAHGVPVTSAILPTSIYFYKDPDTFFNRLNNYFVFTIANLLFNYYTKEQDQLVEKYFGSGYPTSVELLKDPGLLFINYHNAIHGVRPFTPSIVPVSGLHIEDKNEALPNDLQKWLDDSEDGFIYFAFGSMVRTETFPEPLIKAMYEAFESIAPMRVLWKIILPEELPPNLPKNVLTQKWFQQQVILKHRNLKAFVTHGGLMGMLESIYFGVPMLVIPLFADQYSNAMICERKEMGVQVDFEQIEKKFKDSLHEILRNPVYKRNVERISKEYKDAPLRPIDRATYWVEYVARHGNKALRSPLLDMPWWQIKLLDIYAFLSAIVASALYALARLLKTLSRLLASEKCNRHEKKVKKH